jgi:hypothetical protein
LEKHLGNFDHPGKEAMIRAFPVFMLFALPLQMAPACFQADDTPPKRPLVLELEATSKSFAKGTVPTFKLKIKNEGKAVEKILKLRGDLQDTYYDLEVTQNGKPVQVPRFISDPGLIGDSDYVTLKPGESVTFELKRFASAWESLPVGKFKAVVQFWPPGEPGEKKFASPEALFEIAR